MRNRIEQNTMIESKPKSLKLRLGAYLLSLLTVLNPVIPALASVLPDDVIQSDFNNNPIFIVDSRSTHQFQTPQFIEWSTANTKSLESVYQELIATHSSAISEPTYVPIGVGDITTFIPIYTRYNYIGTPAVQARYVRTQLMALLGRNLINSDDAAKYGNEATQLNTLYSNAIAYAKNNDIRYGDLLNVDQDASGLLNANGEYVDMIWPELRRINNQDVIVPIVYLSAATVAARKVVQNETEVPATAIINALTVRNTRVSLARDAFLSVSGDINLTNSELSSNVGTLKITAGGKFDNASSIVTTNGDLTIGAKSIHNHTIVYRYDLGNEQGTRYGTIAEILSENGDVVLESHGDIEFEGADLSAENGAVTLQANGNIVLGTQTLLSSSESQFRGGSRSRSSVSYLQSHINAQDTISLIAGGYIVLDAAELVSDQGQIELLAGMGVHITDALAETQSSYSAKWGKLSETAEAYKTVAMRSILDAGRGITINTTAGNITLKAADISSVDGTSVSASAGGVNLLMTTVNDHYSYTSVKESLFTVKSINRGHSISTGIPNSIVGGFAVEAAQGLQVQYPGDPDLSFEEQLVELEKMPGMEWIAVARDISDPADWEALANSYEDWDESNTSLSPAAIAVLTVVVACAVGPGAGALGTAIGGPLGASVTAGLTSLATQATVITANSAVNGEFNPYKIQKEIVTKEVAQSVATAMVTAAAISYVDSSFFGEVDADELGKLAEAQGVPVDQVNAGWLHESTGQLNLLGQSTQVVTSAVVSSGLQTMAAEGNWSDFTDSFVASMYADSVNKLGQVIAAEIGDLAHLPDGERISSLSKYLMHAGLGCATGFAQMDIGGGNRDAGCLSGAVGGVVGEATEMLHDSTASEFDEWIKQELANGTYDPERTNAKINSFVARGVNIGRVAAGLTAFLAGGDVDIASGAAATAAIYNASSRLDTDLLERAEDNVYHYSDSDGRRHITDGRSPKDHGSLDLEPLDAELVAREEEKKVKAAEYADYYKHQLFCELNGMSTQGCSVNAYNFSDNFTEEEKAEMRDSLGEESLGSLHLKQMSNSLKFPGAVAEGSLVVFCEGVGFGCGAALLTSRTVNGQDVGFIETVVTLIPAGGAAFGFVKPIFKSSKSVKTIDTIPANQLGEYLGTGRNKIVSSYDGDFAVGVLKPGKPGMPAPTLSDFTDEIATLKTLEKQGLPVVKVHGLVHVDGVPAIVYDRYAKGSKEVVELVGGKMTLHPPNSASALLNQNSIDDLEYIRKTLISKKIWVNDLQFLIATDGHVVISDPLHAKLGQSPSTNNKDMIRKLITAAKRNF